jgi:hypothetical protein
LPPGRIVEGSYHVCLDLDGHVSDVKPVVPLAGASDVERILREWSWFFVSDHKSCFDASVVSATPGAGRVVPSEKASITAVPARPVAPPLPAWYRALHAGEEVALSYRACADANAHVQEVTPVAGDATVDDYLEAAIIAAAWNISVSSDETPPYCFATTINLKLPSPATPSAQLPPLPPATPYPTRPAVQPGISVIVRPELVAHRDPHLPDEIKLEMANHGGGSVYEIYRSCIRPDGVVASVEPFYGNPTVHEVVLPVVLSWRYKPMPVGMCSIGVFTFTISTF